MLNINLEHIPRGHGLAALALLLVLSAVLVHGWPENSPSSIRPEECEALCGGDVVSWSPTWCSCLPPRSPEPHARTSTCAREGTPTG